ncbi:prepilin peptidase [Oceanimonas smirnovii]|uniref:prepilin peptidase n=1 Tax=Oceanimonas smirnovii TaxID=264574 RepID=UPI00035CAACF|nr:prepilin peptidase [Oceanimonas smirnovii]
MAALLTLLWLLLCALQDLQQRRIANRLTLPALGFALLWLLWYGSTFAGTGGNNGLTAALIALALTLPGFLLGKMGAGDIKMMLAFALLTGPMAVLWAVALAALGLLGWQAAAVAVWPHLPAAMQRYAWTLAPSRHQQRPYAPFVFIAAVIYFLAGY